MPFKTVVLGASLTLGLIACGPASVPATSETSTGVLGSDWIGPTQLPPQALQGSAFLSDLTPNIAANGWGPWEKDRSNAEQPANDGKTLSIGGQTYAKGLGVHAGSTLTYNLSGSGCSTFAANIGVDDETGDRGSVVFEVLVDGVSKFKSGVLKGTDGPQAVSVPLSGSTQLTLKVSNAADGYSYDHADWASARVSCGEAEVSTTFTGTDTNFSNPERGFHGYASDLAADPSGSLDYVAAAGDRLVRSYVRLDAYRASALDAAWLVRLNQGFERARKAGLKLILRFTYNYPDESFQDASLSQVVQHIQQLKPVLAQNADVIADWQAGFIGQWGEWHDSTNGLDSDASKAVIRDALLAAVPPGTFLQIRYPVDVRKWFAQPPTEADAFTDRARIGIHNDCFLAGEGDTGTYSGLSDPLREYAKALAKITPFGAETCDIGTLRWDCPDILREGKAYSLTYLNRDFYAPFLDRWRVQGCYDEVARSMGYRFRLVRASHPARAAKGSRWTLALTLHNDGWSRLFSARQVKVVLRNRSTGQTIERLISGVDPRRWLSGADSSVALTLTLPADAASGQYDVLIGLPDAAPGLSNDVRYSVRFANADNSAHNQGWESNKGLFRLGTTLTIN